MVEQRFCKALVGGSIPLPGLLAYMHKKIKGDLAEMAVAARLIEEGWRVLFPVGETNRYDLVAERNGKFVRIQVKYVTPKNGVLDVNCRSSNDWSVLHYTSEEIDMIAAYNAHDKLIYFIPVNKINHNLFKLRLEKTKNNQKLKIHRAEDFTRMEI